MLSALGAILLVCSADSTFEDDPEFRLARKQYALLRIHVKEARQLAATLDRLPDLFAEVIQRDKVWLTAVLPSCCMHSVCGLAPTSAFMLQARVVLS